jgi:uncharacterized membrane protein HdeD (DUF308 family)
MVYALGDWRITMLRATAALVFGVLTLLWPGLTLLVLVVMFGAFVLVDGISELIDVVRSDTAVRARRGWRILDGVLGVLAGLITFVWPGITALVLLVLIAAWAILTGGVRLWAAIKVRHEFAYAWLFGLSGVLSVVFGVLLLITPGTGALVVTWLIGWYSLMLAVLLFMHGWYERGIERGTRFDMGSVRPVAM